MKRIVLIIFILLLRSGYIIGMAELTLLQKIQINLQKKLVIDGSLSDFFSDDKDISITDNYVKYIVSNWRGKRELRAFTQIQYMVEYMDAHNNIVEKLRSNDQYEEITGKNTNAITFSWFDFAYPETKDQDLLDSYKKNGIPKSLKNYVIRTKLMKNCFCFKIKK